MRGATGTSFGLGTATFLALAGCNGGPCQESEVCPVVDLAPAADDSQYEFPPGSLVGFSSGNITSTETLAGGDLVTGPVSCDNSDQCTITVKKLSFRFEELSVGYSGGGGTVTAAATVVSFATPLTLTGSALAPTFFALPAGSVVHTCSTLNGRPWHASAALASAQALSVTAPFDVGGVAEFAGTLPVVLRADDAQCSRFTFDASFIADAPRAPTQDAGATDDALAGGSDDATLLEE